jgi:uncharacterized membrane protein
MIGLPHVYAVAGAIFLAFAGLSLRARRPANAGFYALIALSFWAGDRIGDIGNGTLVVALVALAATGRMAAPRSPEVPAEARAAEAARRGNRLFLPMLVVPLVALAGTLAFKQLPTLFDAKQATLVALALGVLLALVAGYAWLRPRASTPFVEGLRLMDAVGWAAVLPQMLVALGAVFALAGVGEIVGGLAGMAIPAGSLFGAVLAYGLGMALFTMVMGNAFAAFPVMATAIGVPLLVRGYGGDPAIVAAMGMLCGFCGTLMTPMAANFNIVPAALLELRDRNGVIKAQVPTALPLLAVNILLIWWLGFAK